jgi:alpha-beta hydrolase superfamily lysophospholipase
MVGLTTPSRSSWSDFWAAQGVRFYAIDLRKYGRIRRPEKTPGFVTDLATYDEDLAAALAAMRHGPGNDSTRRLLLMGHSTGGLTLSLWVARNPGRAVGLILNSPWLEFQTRAIGRRMKGAVGLHA